MKRQQETTCPYCGVGCGVRAQIDDDRVIAVSGSQGHPANRGRLCVKGSALHETLASDARLLRPRIHGEDTDWATAIDAVAQGFKDTIAKHGPDSVAFYVSGQLLTEDYYVANKLMKGFIGSGNIDTNSRLCMSSAVAAYKRAFGSDTVPANYEDLEAADLLVVIGSNAAWTHPVLFQRMQAARQEPGGKHKRMVVIDPRNTATAQASDLHLPLATGTDAVLFNGLLAWLDDHGYLDQAYIKMHTEGFAASLNMARRTARSIPEVARQCDLAEADVLRFYQWFADTDRTVSFYSMGINQSTSGVDKANAIINVHLATGRVGKPGASPFSITGQPNAMGGREVGGLANQLAAHMSWESQEDVARVARFWRAENMATGPGTTAVDLFDQMAEGKIKAVWIMATNPVVSMPEADKVKAALERCELVVVSDCMANTDTLALADIALPATGWSEKDGTVSNSERRVSRQRALRPPMGEARHDWWIITQVAGAMGFKAAFRYTDAVEIFREHAQLSGYENGSAGSAESLTGTRRGFDISAWADITRPEYDALTPLQWPVNQEHPMGCARVFSDGRFHTESGRARFIPISPRTPQRSVSEALPFRFNTGRMRDQWHTMTRTGLAERLSSHSPEPRVMVHPDTAARLHVTEGQWLRVFNELGEARGRALITAEQRLDEVFMPIHWTGQYASHGRVGALVPGYTDAISRQPELKHAVVAVEPWAPAVQGYCWLPEALAEPDWTTWVRRDLVGGVVYQYALAEARDLQHWVATTWPEADVQIFSDNELGLSRVAVLEGNRLRAAIWQEPELPDVTPGWLAARMGEQALEPEDRRDLLAGRSSGLKDPGPLVCSCHQVGTVPITEAITSGRCPSVNALGKALKCGTQCGSCIPELEALLRRHGKQAA